jgi:hypothetical protein
MRKKIYLSGCILLLALLLGAPSFGSDFPEYSAMQLKTLLDRGEPLFLLCPLADIIFNEKNIPGSENIPLADIMKTKKLPEDKSALIVTYCLGPK